jgi:hypothetical protein
LNYSVNGDIPSLLALRCEKNINLPNILTKQLAGLTTGMPFKGGGKVRDGRIAQQHGHFGNRAGFFV